MKIRTSICILLCYLGAFGNCLAGNSVSIRLVHASNSGEGVEKGLEDIGKILQSQLAFKKYEMVDRKSCSLPADKTIKMTFGYLVKCLGTQENLTINVSQKKKELLKTTVSLQDGKPLILGGFPGEGGKLLLILLAK